jgi:hypothetical protein
VIDTITHHPRSPLATTLASPLRLFLAVPAYHRPGTDPAELTCLPDSESLNDYLLSQLIPATTIQHPRLDGTTYDSEDVTRWLTTLANYLKTRQTQYNGSGSDIALSELWTAAGPRKPRYLTAALYGLLTALAVPAFVSWHPTNPLWTYMSWGLTSPSGSHLRGILAIRPASYLSNEIAVGIGCALVSLSTFRASGQPAGVRRLSLAQLRTTIGRRRLAAWLGAGLTVGLPGGDSGSAGTDR